MQAHLLSSEIKKKKKEQTIQRPLILTPTDVSPQVVSVTAVRHDHGRLATVSLAAPACSIDVANVDRALNHRW